jgi:hypothetical protein
MLRISSKAPRKRPVTQGNGTDIACIMPCKIRLNCTRTPEDRRVQYGNQGIP